MKNYDILLQWIEDRLKGKLNKASRKELLESRAEIIEKKKKQDLEIFYNNQNENMANVAIENMVEQVQLLIKYHLKTDDREALPLKLSSTKVAIPLSYIRGEMVYSTFVTLSYAKNKFNVIRNPIRSIDISGKTKGHLFISSNEMDFMMQQIKLLIAGKLDRKENPINKEIFG